MASSFQRTCGTNPGVYLVFQVSILTHFEGDMISPGYIFLEMFTLTIMKRKQRCVCGILTTSNSPDLGAQVNIGILKYIDAI